MTTPEPLPYGATTDRVRQYVLDTAAGGLRVRPGADRVTDATVAGWITEAAGLVAARTWRVAGLPAGPDPAGLDRLDALAVQRHLVELYAAALVQDVTHPELSGDARPGKPLLDRFYLELDGLVGDVTAALDSGTVEVEATDDDLPGALFPDVPLVTRSQAF